LGILELAISLSDKTLVIVIFTGVEVQKRPVERSDFDQGMGGPVMAYSGKRRVSKSTTRYIWVVISSLSSLEIKITVLMACKGSGGKLGRD
jgi:hypothetical protein